MEEQGQVGNDSYGTWKESRASVRREDPHPQLHLE